MHGRALIAAALLALLAAAPAPAAPPRYAVSATPGTEHVVLAFADRRSAKVRFRVCVGRVCASGRTTRRARAAKVELRLPAGAHLARFSVRGRVVRRLRFTVGGPPQKRPAGDPAPPAPAPPAMPGVVPPAPPAAVRQPAFVGTAGTPGCDGATTWRIGLRIFRADDAGGTVSAEKRAAVLGWQQQWADRVGTYGQCAVRVVVDVYDMEDAVARAGEYQPDVTGLREKGDYDVLFDLVPEVPNPGWVEKTNGTHAVFLDVAGNPNLPGQDVHLHAWLHSVEIWYVRVDIPPKGIHGYNDPPYATMPNRTAVFYEDFMRGRVEKAGSPGTCVGMLPGYWAEFGTPRHPKHSDTWRTGHPCP